VVEYGPGEAKHHACLHLPDRRAFVASDLIYNGAHLYLMEHTLEGWLDRLAEFELFVADHDVQTIFPGHGPAGGLSLIQGTREYLEAFASAIKTGNAHEAREILLSRFPGYHAEVFLTAFSLPAYLPAGDKEE
jgi:glyoxylase-like metal-dependent hydrolase (beta-lactamase superfamily II)